MVQPGRPPANGDRGGRTHHPGAARADQSSASLPIPENIAAVIAYITIIPAIVFLYLEPFKHHRFVRFHAYQHIFLWAVGLAFAFAATILWTVMQLIPAMRVLVFPFTGLIMLAWFFLWLLLVFKAYRHETFKLPFIGDLAETRSHSRDQL
jgi:uncharacterized membrane protein